MNDKVTEIFKKAAEDVKKIKFDIQGMTDRFITEIKEVK